MEAELAKYGAYGIAIFSLSILFWVIKRGADTFSSLNDSIRENTKVTNENLIYLKNKNGSMEKCFVDVTNKLERITGNQNIITDKLSRIDNDVQEHNRRAQ